jgi:HSP20 family protein
MDSLPRRRARACSSGTAPLCWRPAVDVYRHAGGWICKFDLAGVRQDEFEVRIGRRSLTLSGVRRDAFAAEGMRAWSLEIAYCRFERTVELPCDLDRAEIACELRDGMLLVSVAVAETVP